MEQNRPSYSVYDKSHRIYLAKCSILTIGWHYPLYEGSAFRYFGLQKHEIWVIWKGKCNARLEKTLYYTDFWAKKRYPFWHCIKRGNSYGAGGGTRTHTMSPPTDFESVTSTIPSHREIIYQGIIYHLFENSKYIFTHSLDILLFSAAKTHRPKNFIPPGGFRLSFPYARMTPTRNLPQKKGQLLEWRNWLHCFWLRWW